MILNLSQSKIYSSNKFGRFSRLGIVQASLTSALGLTKRSSNFREALQPQSVNKFTLDVCTPSRLLKQSHKFCTQRAEAHLAGATQRKCNLSPAFARRGEIKKILLVNMINAIVSHIKSLRSNLRLRLCSLRRIIGTAMPVREVYKKAMANLFDDWLLRDYTNFVEQNDDSSARNKKQRGTKQPND